MDKVLLAKSSALHSRFKNNAFRTRKTTMPTTTVVARAAMAAPDMRLAFASPHVLSSTSPHDAYG